jgi:2-phosphoglycerate kinase
MGEDSGLADVYWIGGASGAGKSTMSKLLAARHGLRIYSTDDVMSDHAARSTPADSPMLAEFAAMDMDERWVRRSPETMLETFHWYRGESFAPIVEDLLALPAGPPVIAEGFRLLPSLVKPLLTEERRAIWLLPTPEFRRAAFDHRGSTWKIAERTGDPQRALANLLARDRMFTERLREDVRAVGLRLIEVDRLMAEDDLAAAIEDAWGLT